MTRSKTQAPPIKSNGGVVAPVAEPTLVVVTTPGQTTYGSALDEVFQGTSGDDQIVGLGGADRIEGGAGNDTLHGNRLGLDFADDPFADSLYGGLGNDLLVGDRGDLIDGGAGSDTFQSTFRTSVMPALSYTHSQDAWIRFAGVDSIRLVGVEAFDLTGTTGADTITGGWGNDTFRGRGGEDVVSLGGGNDVLEVDFRANFQADGGAGNDRIELYGLEGAITATSVGGVSVTSGGVTRTAQGFEALGLEFGMGNLRFTGGASHDRILGGGELIPGIVNTSRHVVDTGAGDDEVQLTGQARILLGFGHDIGRLIGSGRLLGGSGDDSLYGSGEGQKLISGELGNDYIFVSGGACTVRGGLGDDTLSAWYAMDPATFLDGGAGIDTVFFAAPPGATQGTTGVFEGPDYLISGLRFRNVERVEFTGSTSGDRVEGGALNDVLKGEGLFERRLTDADTLSGMGGDDTILGGAGRDVLLGGQGADLIYGGSEGDDIYSGEGDDTLTGGLGADTLEGGTGADVFVFGAEEAFSMGAGDLIRDFTRGEDKIDLSALGDLTFIGSAVFGRSAGEVRAFVQGEVIFIRGDMNGDGVADMSIMVTGSFTLTAADFIL